MYTENLPVKFMGFLIEWFEMHMQWYIYSLTPGVNFLWIVELSAILVAHLWLQITSTVMGMLVKIK
jgi:hypothetical protein